MVDIVLTKSDPIYLNCHLPLDPYIVKNVINIENVSKELVKNRLVSASWARENGYKVDPEKKDNDEVEIVMTETVNMPVQFSETRLRQRKNNQKKKKAGKIISSGRNTVIQAELYDAALDPLSYLGNKTLANMVNDEIKYWSNNNIGNRILDPIVLVFLDIRDEDTRGYLTTARKIFYIKRYSLPEIVVEDSSSNEWCLNLSENVIKSGIIRRFILFLPSNAIAFDYLTQKRIF